MPTIKVKKALGGYGFEDKEIRVYLALLSLGEATATGIARVSKIKRTTVYLVLERLIEKGIVSQYKAKYGTHYTALKPKQLIKRFDDIRIEFEKIIPELEAIKKKEIHEPVTRLYKGKEGYIVIFNESLESDSHEKILYLGSARLQNEIVGEKYIAEKYIPTRLKKRIKLRQLMIRDEFSQRLKLRATEELREIRFLPEDFHVEANVLIFQDKVAFFSSKRELNCVVIQSQDIAVTERKKFNLLWDSC